MKFGHLFYIIGIITAYGILNSFYRFYGCLLVLCITFAIGKGNQ